MLGGNLSSVGCVKLTVSTSKTNSSSHLVSGSTNLQPFRFSKSQKILFVTYHVPKFTIDVAGFADTVIYKFL